MQSYGFPSSELTANIYLLMLICNKNLYIRNYQKLWADFFQLPILKTIDVFQVVVQATTLILFIPLDLFRHDIFAVIVNDEFIAQITEVLRLEDWNTFL